MTGIIQALLASIGASGPKQYLGIPRAGFWGTPRGAVYNFENETLGTVIADPATAFDTTEGGPSWTSNGDAIAWPSVSSPFVYAYPFSKISGYGAKFSNPSPLPFFGQCIELAFSPNKNAIALVGGGGIQAYAWSSSGFGAKFSDPATQPTNTSQAIAFTPSSNAVAVVSTGAPYVWAYPWSGSGFGAKFSDPATLMPGGTNLDVKFSPAGNAIVTNTASGFPGPYVFAYAWSGSGFGAKFSDPATPPASGGHGVAFSSDGAYLAVCAGGSPFVYVYPWSGSSGFGAVYAGPATSIVTRGISVDFSPDVGSIAVINDNQRAYVYAWSSGGWGARTAGTFPSEIPGRSPGNIKFGVVE